MRTHDFKDKKLGHAIPYGILDLTRDEGWVSVGIDSNTAQFAAASIQAWWEQLGSERYPQATTLTITADCGGSNGNRLRLSPLAPRLEALSLGLRGVQASLASRPAGKAFLEAAAEATDETLLAVLPLLDEDGGVEILRLPSTAKIELQPGTEMLSLGAPGDLDAARVRLGSVAFPVRLPEGETHNGQVPADRGRARPAPRAGAGWPDDARPREFDRRLPRRRRSLRRRATEQRRDAAVGRGRARTPSCNRDAD